MSRKFTTLASVLLAVCNTMQAQTVFVGTDAQKVLNNAQQVEMREGINTPSFATFENSGTSAKRFFEQYKSQLGLGSNDAFVLKTSETDEIGYKQYRFQQYYLNTPVEGGEYILQEKAGVVTGLSGCFYNNITTGGNATITENAALLAAKTAIDAKVYKWELADEEAFLKDITNDKFATYLPKATLVLINTNLAGSTPTLKTAYKFELRTCFLHYPNSQ